MKIWATLAVILTTLTLEAKVFRNAYVAFELPDTWKCALEHTEWVCRSESNTEAREAIIILTAKEVGPTDSFDAYTQHLATLQKQSPGARVVYPPKQVKINDQVWIDGLHMGSEVTNYFTRYLATIKDRIAILVTYSAHKNFYTKYSQDFFKSIQSLRVIATKNLLDKPESGGAMRPGLPGESFGAPLGGVMPEDMPNADGQGSAGSQGQKTKMMMLGVAVLLAGLAIYIFIKMKQK
ncbi:MAG: hypothetical protein ACXWC9_08930 [Pseudobdellovibrionaceae bacterium]